MLAPRHSRESERNTVKLRLENFGQFMGKKLIDKEGKAKKRGTWVHSDERVHRDYKFIFSKETRITQKSTIMIGAGILEMIKK